MYVYIYIYIVCNKNILTIGKFCNKCKHNQS